VEQPRERVRRWLVQAVRNELAPRRAALASLVDAARPLPLHLSAVELRLDGLSHRVVAQSAGLARVGAPFAPDFTIDEVLRRHAGAAQVLAGFGLPGCGGCAVRQDETLAEAADAYGLDLEAMLDGLQGLLAVP
jgi:hybrid cluster-associated redox disulfide protein